MKNLGFDIYLKTKSDKFHRVNDDSNGLALAVAGLGELGYSDYESLAQEHMVARDSTVIINESLLSDIKDVIESYRPTYSLFDGGVLSSSFKSTADPYIINDV